MHFSTQQKTDYGSTIYNWYRMDFKDDFVEYLETEHKLPVASLKEQTAQMEENEKLKGQREAEETKFLKQKAISEQYEAQIEKLKQDVESETNERQMIQQKLDSVWVGAWTVALITLAVSANIYRLKTQQ